MKQNPVQKIDDEGIIQRREPLDTASGSNAFLSLNPSRPRLDNFDAKVEYSEYVKVDI